MSNEQVANEGCLNYRQICWRLLFALLITATNRWAIKPLSRSNLQLPPLTVPMPLQPHKL
jgi:hypothetical protein